MAKPSEEEISRKLEVVASNEIRASVTWDNTTLSQDRQDAIDYIEGRMKQWPAERGRSSVVDMTTLDTLSWVLPAIVRLFMASDNMVIAEPRRQQDEQWAKQATAGLNYDFMDANDGYAILYDTTFSSLLHGDGMVKCWWDDTPEERVSFHSQLSEEQLQYLLQPEETGTSEDGEPMEEVELVGLERTMYTLQPGDEGYVDPAASLGQPGGPAGMAPMTAQPSPEGAQEGMPAGASGMPQDAGSPSQALDVQSGMEIAPAGLPEAVNANPLAEVGPAPNQRIYYDAKIRRTCRYGQIKWAAIAPENFIISRGALSIEKARCVGDREQMTRSDLIEMGFDRDKVMALTPGYDPSNEQLERDNGQSSDISEQPIDNELMETVWLYELYLKYDVDDDGVVETVQIHYADNGGMGSLLDWQVWEDECSYSQIPCYRFPHRWNSNGLFTRTRDLQEIKTVIKRQTLDSLYAAVNPQKVVRGRVLNPDELSNPSFGGSILMDDAASTVESLEVPFQGQAAIEVIRYLDEELEKRTGVSRTTTSLDPEALQNTTATASQLAHDASYAQIELIARNMAELGWKPAFRNALKLKIRHQRRRQEIRLADGKFTEVDPRHWNADMSVSINTGLGTGSRDRDLAVLSSVKADQVSFAQVLREAQMPGRALQMVPKMANALRKSAEAAGIKNVDQFYIEISDQDVQAAAQAVQQKNQQPPIEVQLAQMEAQIRMQEKQADVQVKQQELQLKAQADASKEAAQMEADLQVKDKEMQRDLVIADNEQQFEHHKLMVEAAEKEKDRQLQLQIETMKINAQAEQARMQAEQQAIQSERDFALKREEGDRTSQIEREKIKASDRASQRQAEAKKVTKVNRDGNGRATSYEQQ